MGTAYFWMKFIHILIAILALGTSAGLGILLELYGDKPSHGVFLLRAIERIELLFVIPGYVLMLATGLWMVHLSWPLTAKWVEVAIVLWSIGLILLGVSLYLLHKQIKLFNAEGPVSEQYRRTALLDRFFGAASGFVVVAILYLMVFKP